MAGGFATGKRALAMCQRCGCQGRYADMIDDPYKPGLRVHKDCADQKHPAERPVDVSDATALRRPSPNIDDDSPGSEDVTLTEAMGWENYFGGGT